jgi:hypothetical protein
MGIGDWITDNIFDSKNKERAGGYQVNSNAYNYGGRQGGAEAAANGYAAQGAVAQGRTAPQAATTVADYADANAAAAQGQQARQGQNTLANLMSQRAQGLAGPSIAQQQADRQMQQAQSQQASLAGSARGAGGLAAAQRNAAFNMANAASDISGQAQINAAGERRDDTNAAASMYGAMRGGDLGSQGQAASQAQFQAANSAQQNQFNAGLQLQNRNANDAYQQNYDAMANQVRTTQLAAKMNQQGQQSANTLGAQGINAGVGGQNAAMNQANTMNVLGMAQSAAGGAAGVLAKAKGGPTSEGKPYLVGEQGPELIVPRHDGYVLTADQTRAALASSPADAVNGLYRRGHEQARGASLASFLGGARADGGPVEAGGAAPPPAQAPAGYAAPISTWGIGQPDPNTFAWQSAREQEAQMAPYDDLDARIKAQRSGIDATAARVNDTVSGIDARDKDAIFNADYKDRHGQSLSRAEDDAAIEARYRQSEDNKQAKATAKKSRSRMLQDTLAEMGKGTQQQAQGVDTAYHGGGGHYVPPQLIQISGARAMGGPISAGGLVPLNGPGVGVGGGIEFGGGGITHTDLLRAGSGLAQRQPVPGMVGGGGITGGSTMGGAAIPGIAGAREDGGPIKGSDLADAKARAVEETAMTATSPTRVPAATAGKYDTQLTPVEEKAFQQWKAKYAPADSGEDYDYRGAFKAGATPGEDGHWVDTFKKPNHPTFSNESQYARGADAAKAGHWEGDNFVPPFSAQTRAEKQTANTNSAAKDMARYALMAATGYGLPITSPGLAAILGANAAGTAGAAAAMGADDEAARKAREEQAAIDEERAAMNRAERGGGPAVAPKRSLWDLLRGK